MDKLYCILATIIHIVEFAYGRMKIF